MGTATLRAATLALGLAAGVLTPRTDGRPAHTSGFEFSPSVRVLANLRTSVKEVAAGEPLDVIVTFNRPLGRLDPTLLPWPPDRGYLRHVIPTARAVACRMSPEQIDVLARSGVVAQLEADVEVHAMREASNLAFGTTAARTDFGLTGDGDGDPARFSAADHTIAILDTGIDAQHADFAGGKVIGWRDFVNNRSEPYDDHGHGTHLASIAAGRRVGNSSGVAPGAALVGLKVLRRSGSGRVSDIAAGLEYCIQERERLGIEVINISLGTDEPTDGTDLASRMDDRAVEAGMVAVVAAGNTGPLTRTIGAPGAAEGAITVGSMADPARGGFALSSFSARGPTEDGRVKPDLCAPGESILAARANSGTGYRRFSGTSMAAPFVAGVASLMRAADLTLASGEIKRILMQTAVDFGSPGMDVDYGAGRLDAYQAISTALERRTTSPVSPAHWAARDTLGDQAVWERPLRVTSTAFPVAITLLNANWSNGGGPSFALRLLDPSGQVVAESAGAGRQEAIRVLVRQPGVYTLQVLSRAGAGGFILDVSGGIELRSSEE